jgi:radical SAM superfamily enzyme YgiQ (UPF0313 family)
MLTLINTNRMTPAIGPIGLDYIAGAVQSAGIDVEVLDLCFLKNPAETIKQYFAAVDCELVGVSFRNADDSFWPNGEWFVPGLKETVRQIKSVTAAPIVLGGVGFSIFGGQIIKYTGADFGICGDGESSIVSLLGELRGAKRFEKVPGLIWRRKGDICSNRPDWPEPIVLSTSRNAVDNRAYFACGGQCGIETKRGCNRQCIYCADPLAKGPKVRVRSPSEVADEVEILLSEGIDVLHFCDAEFNIPREHAYAVCEEFNRRALGNRVRWYTYMSVVPFDEELAKIMKQAGCVGINFGGDSACESMLRIYRRGHHKEDLASAVRFCRSNGTAVMIDLLLGGPGETRETVAETINFLKKINPDCVGAALGVRVYPRTVMEAMVSAEGTPEKNPNIRRKYDGPIDFFKPTFYISKDLGENPAEFVCDLIGGDSRFFPPRAEVSSAGRTSADHNYNDNARLVEAIGGGARGAYWDILRKLPRE